MLSESNISAANGPEILSKFFLQNENQQCFDCDAPATEFISVNNGVSLCRKCAEAHRAFGNDDISLVKSAKAEGWSVDELKLISLGGNKKLSGFLKEWDIEKDKNYSIYKTKGSYHYRRQLQYDIDGFNQPEPITKANAKDIVDGKPLLTKASENIQKAGSKITEKVADAKTAVQDPNFAGNIKEKAVHLKDETINLASKGIETIKSGIQTAVEKIKEVTHLKEPTTGQEESKETSESLHQKAAQKENVTKAPKDRETGSTTADRGEGTYATSHPVRGEVHLVREPEDPAPREHPATRPNRFEDTECVEKHSEHEEGTPVQLADLVYRYEQEHHHLPPLETSSKDLVISQLKHHTDPVLREHLTRASKKVNIEDKLSDKVTPISEKKSGDLTPKDATNKGKETFSDKAMEAKEDLQAGELKVQGDPLIKKPVNVAKEGQPEVHQEVKYHGDPFAREFVTRASKKINFESKLNENVTPISEKKSGELTPKDANEHGTATFGDKATEAKDQKFEEQELKIQGDPMIKHPSNIIKSGEKPVLQEHKIHGDPFMKEFVTRASKQPNIQGKFSDKVTPVSDKKSGDLTPKDANDQGADSFNQKMKEYDRKAQEELQEMRQEIYNFASGKTENITKAPKKNQ